MEYDIKDSGQRTEFATGAVRDMSVGKGRFDLLPMNALMELAKHTEKGAIKYGDGNVKKGILAHSFYDSAMRHMTKWYLGQQDEDHLIAAIWNLMWLAEQRTTHPELDDIHGATPVDRSVNPNEQRISYVEADAVQL